MVGSINGMSICLLRGGGNIFTTWPAHWLSCPGLGQRFVGGIRSPLRHWNCDRPGRGGLQTNAVAVVGAEAVDFSCGCRFWFYWLECRIHVNV